MTAPPRTRPSCCLILAGLFAVAPGREAAVGGQPGAVDILGDPLPEHARARLGTARFRAGTLINQAIYTPEGKTLVAIDQQAAIRLWDVRTGRIIRRIGERTADFCEMSLSTDGTQLASNESPNRIRLWDLATGRELRKWHQADNETHESPRFSADGRFLATKYRRGDPASGKIDRSINLWEIASSSEKRRLVRGHWFEIWAFEFSSDGRSLMTVSVDEQRPQGPEKWSIRVFDLGTLQERRRMPIDVVDPRVVAFSPDGKFLAAAGSDQSIHLHDLVTGREHGHRLELEPAPPPPRGARLPDLPLPPWGYSCLAFSPDGSILATGEFKQRAGVIPEASIRVWDVAQGRALRRIPAPQQWVRSMCFSPDGKTLASCGMEAGLRLWDVATGREAMPQPGHRSAIRTLVVSPADGTIVTGGLDGTIRHWDPSTGRELGVITFFESPVDSLAIAPDGQRLLLGQIKGRRLSLWDIAERWQIRNLSRRAERDPVRHVAFAPDGKTVASERRIWDADTGRVLVDFRDRDEHNNGRACYFPIFYSSDGRQVITSEEDGVRVWEMATGQEVRWAVRARIHQDRVALSRDGRYVATGALVARYQGDESAPPIDVWEMASGQKVASLVGNATSTNSLCFSPDGRWLASCSGDRRTGLDATVRIWDVTTGRELRRFSGHDGPVNVVAYAPDGRSVISGGADGTGLVWDVSDLRADRPAGEPLTREAIQARWDELAGPDARAAHRATWALGVPSAVPFVREHLHPASAPDPKGVPAANGPIAPPGTLRSLRAIAALERAGTPEARSTIEVMANGHPAAIETREAKASLERLR